MKKFKLIFTALAACVIFTACGQIEDPHSTESDSKPSQSEDVETVTDTNVTDAEGENESLGDNENTNITDDTEELPEDNAVQPELPKYTNKLTGLETTEELADIRPVAVMINNLKKALPQQGISQADIIYEVLAEGGITRLLCLFTDYASLPETGSVRSARDYYIDLSDAHDAIYVHCGTSPQATEVLTARKTDHMDGIYFDTPFYRNMDRWNSMGQEHSLMTTGEGLVKGIAQKKFRTTGNAEQPLKFLAEVTELENGAKIAKNIDLKFSYYQTAEFDYDEENGVYFRSQYGEPHMDANNDTQLSFTNVLFLYCTQGAIPGDDAGRLYVNFYGDGAGYYFTGGEYVKIKWHKDSRTSTYALYYEDGTTPLEINPGKTYIAIAPTGAETVIE